MYYIHHYGADLLGVISRVVKDALKALALTPRGLLPIAYPKSKPGTTSSMHILISGTHGLLDFLNRSRLDKTKQRWSAPD